MMIYLDGENWSTIRLLSPALGRVFTDLLICDPTSCNEWRFNHDILAGVELWE